MINVYSYFICHIVFVIVCTKEVLTIIYKDEMSIFVCINVDVM